MARDSRMKRNFCSFALWIEGRKTVDFSRICQMFRSALGTQLRLDFSRLSPAFDVERIAAGLSVCRCNCPAQLTRRDFSFCIFGKKWLVERRESGWMVLNGRPLCVGKTLSIPGRWQMRFAIFLLNFVKKASLEEIRRLWQLLEGPKGDQALHGGTRYQRILGF